LLGLVESDEIRAFRAKELHTQAYTKLVVSKGS
jgi:hypothetical protein